MSRARSSRKTARPSSGEHRSDENEQIEDYARLGFRYPGLGAAMSIFMLSVAGFPPLVGFAGTTSTTS